MNGTPLDITVSDGGASVLVRCAGELDLASASGFREVVASIQATNIVVDCEELRFIDSSGIRVLLDATRRWSGNGVQWEVVASEELRRVADLLGLSEVLKISGNGTSH